MKGGVNTSLQMMPPEGNNALYMSPDDKTSPYPTPNDERGGVAGAARTGFDNESRRSINEWCVVREDSIIS